MKSVYNDINDLVAEAERVFRKTKRVRTVPGQPDSGLTPNTLASAAITVAYSLEDLADARRLFIQATEPERDLPFPGDIAGASDWLGFYQEGLAGIMEQVLQSNDALVAEDKRRRAL